MFKEKNKISGRLFLWSKIGQQEFVGFCIVKKKKTSRGWIDDEILPLSIAYNYLMLMLIAASTYFSIRYVIPGDILLLKHLIGISYSVLSVIGVNYLWWWKY